MDPVYVVVICLACFGAGLLLGLAMLRRARAAAALEGRAAAAREVAALEQQVKGWEERARELGAVVAQHEERAASDRERLVAVTADLARASALAERNGPLTAALDERSRQLDGVRAELEAARVRAAQVSADLDAQRNVAAELERALAECRRDVGAAIAARDGERQRAATAGEQLATAQAELAASRFRVEEAQAEIARLRPRADELQASVTALVEEKTRLASDLDGERKAAAERSAEADRTKEQVRAEIQLLAGRLLDEKGNAMLHQSREGLEALLKPVADKLRDFEQKVEKTYDQDIRDRASLLTSLQKLQDAQAKLHADAESLSRALTGESKVQGDWGELVLERVLETAGLTEGREYDLQVSHRDEDGGRKRPDALVYLPGNRVVVVDAKCSLTAFVEAMRAETEERRRAALAAHVKSVRGHVGELVAKSYQDVVKGRSVDLVLMFVPNEAAFHAAIATDAGLYEAAFKQRVVICSPTTLLAALQLISHVWRTESQNVNAQRIADEAAKLLEKLSAFVTDLDGVGMRLVQAQESFAAAKNKLGEGRGNVLKKARDIVRLGVRIRPDKVKSLGIDDAAEDAIDIVALTGGAALELPAAAEMAETESD
jgi:DNA recombination protein RmuC